MIDYYLIYIVFLAIIIMAIGGAIAVKEELDLGWDKYVR